MNRKNPRLPGSKNAAKCELWGFGPIRSRKTALPHFPSFPQHNACCQHRADVSCRRRADVSCQHRADVTFRHRAEVSCRHIADVSCRHRADISCRQSRCLLSNQSTYILLIQRVINSFQSFFHERGPGGSVLHDHLWGCIRIEFRGCFWLFPRLQKSLDFCGSGYPKESEAPGVKKCCQM